MKMYFANKNDIFYILIINIYIYDENQLNLFIH